MVELSDALVHTKMMVETAAIVSDPENASAVTGPSTVELTKEFVIALRLVLAAVVSSLTVSVSNTAAGTISRCAIAVDTRTGNFTCRIDRCDLQLTVHTAAAIVRYAIRMKLLEPDYSRTALAYAWHRKLTLKPWEELGYAFPLQSDQPETQELSDNNTTNTSQNI